MEEGNSISQIMLRYNIPLNKSLLYSYEELRRMDIDQEFIYTLLQTFEDENAFAEADYEKFSLEVIIDYIYRTHRYYITRKLLEIEQNIQILLKDYAGDHPLLQILNTFFYEYSSGLTSHIQFEEKYLLPYIASLMKFEGEEPETEEYIDATKHYSIKKFIENHHDTEKDLSVVRAAILEYQPPVTNQTPYRILISQLEAFEKDLFVHALIEDRVLIPRALLLEEKINNAVNRISKLN